MTEFFWAWIWPLIIMVAQSLLLITILLVAIAYVLYADPNSFVLWGMGDQEGEPREQGVEEVSAPVEPPKPQIDPAELKVALESYLADKLAEIVKGSIGGLVDEAMARALSGEEAEREGDAGSQAEEADERMDSALFLSALAQSQSEDQPVPPASTPNGVHPPEAEKPNAEDVLGKEEGKEPRRPRRRKADENDPSPGSPSAEA